MEASRRPINTALSCFVLHTKIWVLIRKLNTTSWHFAISTKGKTTISFTLEAKWLFKVHLGPKYVFQ